MSVVELRRLLVDRFPDAVPVTYGTAGAVATGVGALDRLLPGGGLPRGRLSAWAPGGGATAVLLGACDVVVASGERAAWIDGAGTLAGGWRSWAGERGAWPLLLRPGGGKAALECADELSRSGGFALVVLSGAEASGSESVRLSRSAREGGSAVVVVGAGVPVAALRFESRIRPEGCRWRPGPFGEPAEVEAAAVEVRVRGLGLSARTEFLLPVARHELRLSLEPGVVDRRGARP